MTEPMNMNVRVSGALKDFVNSKTGESGEYESVSEYIRDLIRKDKNSTELQVFLEKKRILKEAFAEPRENYVTVTAEDIISGKFRNESRD